MGRRKDINAQMGQAADMGDHVNVKDPMEVNDTVVKIWAINTQNALDASQRKKSAGLMSHFRQKFIVAEDADLTAKGGFKPRKGCTLAQKAGNLLVKAEKAEQPAKRNLRAGKAIDYERRKALASNSLAGNKIASGRV